MYIGNYYQGIMRLFSGMHGRGIHANMPLFGGASRRPNAGGRNTLEDLLTGHYKNSYGVEGMCVTNNPNARKIIQVSDEMKQRVFDNVKDAFYKYNGMSGDNEAEWEEMAQAKNAYYKTLKKSDRAAAAWTLGQFEISVSRKVAGAVKEKVPGWTYGDQIPAGVLDEVFADESITSMVSGKSGTAGGLDIRA
ncbi:hypothetical protein EBB54_06510 [Schaedlerella arabinosiphila]|uniref:Uncharacterized protein n=1 Tax=Schaedlerella arabinosiphila TaxID=2044587 RepID=A0A426DEK5_9FIRM|nr:DUF3879 family protein [Schaedlerella arabinosiphila]RRK31063.1 hypothetical protein EBB54_06510 [Schaedlerella arabinosiphila]